MAEAPAPPGTAPDPLIGQMIDGRWRIMRRLGSGGMGVVYLAERAQLGRQVALKVLHEEYSSSNEFVRRFAREARALSRLQHIHCISILDVGTHGERPYIVMELVPGHPLTEEIGSPAMSTERAVLLVRQVLLGLGHAHGHGIVHRDLKPDNIVVSEHSGVGAIIKILDFGFAHINDSRISQSNAQLVPGTPSYMSPEQAQGLKVDARTDLYSAGIILYELCVGHKLFVAADAPRVLAMHLNEEPIAPRLAAPERHISDALDRVILRALTKDRDQRFQTAEEMQLALEATPEGKRALGQRGAGGSWRKRVLLLVVAALLVAAAAIVALRLR
jgi:eukaryotic-like serine/threonine-protein kinase